MAKPRILVTGFGPFPGFADNPSASARPWPSVRRVRHAEFHARILPTAWEEAAIMPRFYRRSNPAAMMIHFCVRRAPRLFTSKRWRITARRDGAMREA